MEKTSNKIHYIDNERELLDWAIKSAAKVSPKIREAFYEATEPKEIIQLAREGGSYEEEAYKAVIGILARGRQSGTFVTKDDFKEQDFVNYMEGFYIPRMKEVHLKTENWIKYHLGTSAPDLVREMSARGWNSVLEYKRTSGGTPEYYIYGHGGILIGTLQFDGSTKTFTAFWYE